MGQAIQPVVFGAPQRRLFGIFHPAGNEALHPGVVLCNAFGQEAIRAHRMMRVLAERLARQGHPVLRFDYFGSGDSMGEDLDADLDGWTADLLSADAQLRTLSGASRSIWIGMRLGATVALRAAFQAPPGLCRVIAWDAVLDGTRYLDHLRVRHIDTLEGAFALRQRPSPREIGRMTAQSFRDEAIGHAISPAFRAQIEALVAPRWAWPAQPPSLIALSDPDTQDGRDLAEALRTAAGRVRVVPVQHGTDWTSDAADNSALVPTQALLALVQQAQEAA